MWSCANSSFLLSKIIQRKCSYDENAGPATGLICMAVLCLLETQFTNWLPTDGLVPSATDQVFGEGPGFNSPAEVGRQPRAAKNKH